MNGDEGPLRGRLVAREPHSFTPRAREGGGARLPDGTTPRLPLPARASRARESLRSTVPCGELAEEWGVPSDAGARATKAPGDAPFDAKPGSGPGRDGHGTLTK